ncbi:MAG: S8 family serine peptidase, partial [Ferruginibacter sp.]|nr:S8 family serine peptidase [Chitinophagaceae bacterium]
MKKLYPLLFLLVAVYSESQAQFTRYVVKLKNKGGTPFTFSAPLAYLSQRAVDRRTRYNIPIDSTDLPVTPTYITQIRNVPNVTVLNISKWINAVSIQTSDPAAITAINGFPFVQSITGVAARPTDPGRNKLPPEEVGIVSSDRTDLTTADFYNYGTTAFTEINLHNGQFLHNIGLRGQGMQIAMLDGGFLNYNTYRAFDSANLNGQILSTWDFVAREQSVSEDNYHGMSCLSTIVANIPGQFVGKAPKASFHLYRTEDVSSEHRIEEFNWACGAERADSSGADVISTSLGYYIQFTPPSLDHPNSDMDGNTTIPAIAGDLAAKKGLLVFASIGNDGSNSTPTHFLSTPSDGDSVLAIGAVTNAGAVGNFSSYGPSADGQIKPDLASVGVSAVVQTQAGTVGSMNGTSFACPNMAGLGTILWQGFPEFNNMKIRNALWQSG